MPFSPTGYVPQYGDRIAELMMRQGEIAARGAERSGMIWGRAIENLGQIAGNAVENYQQQKQENKQAAALDEFVQSGIWTTDPQAGLAGAIKILGPAKGVTFFAGLKGALDIKKARTPEEAKAAAVMIGQGFQVAPAASKPALFKHAYGLFQEMGALAPGAIPDYNPAEHDPWIQQMTGGAPKPEAPVESVDAQGNPITIRPTSAQLAVGVPKAPPTPRQYQVTVPGPNGPITRLATEAEMQAGVREYQKPTAAESPGYSTGDVKTVVAGMKAGRLPPQLPGRATKEYLAVMAESERQGFDVATAATDWLATQKHIQTLNGSQQERMRQAVVTAYHSFDVIDDLSKKWVRGKFPPLNKAKLVAAKAGALGPEAAKIATQLEAQINDVTSELGVVYMGGNSPTDHALELAAKNLSADWSADVLKAMTDLGRKNLEIRRNSMMHSAPVGVSEDNPYGQGGAPAAPPPGGGGVVEWELGPDGKPRPKGR